MRVFPLACLVFAGIVTCQDVKSYRGHHVLSTKASTEEQLSLLQKLGNHYDLVFLREPSLTLSTDFVVSPEQKGRVMNTLREAGLTVTVQSSDLQAEIDAEQRHSRVHEERELQSTRTVGNFKPDHTYYRNMLMVNKIMTDFQSHYPQLVVMKKLNHETHEGRPVYYLEIGTPTDSNGNGDKPVILLETLTHAREWIGPASTIYSIDMMLHGFKAQNKLMVDVLTDFTWVVIPVNNPDGYVFTWNQDRLWRKNRRPLNSSCVGVDLNRNYDIKFGEVGVSKDCQHEIYPGESPFSEQETQNVRDLFGDLKSRVVSFLSVHSYSQVLLVPWSYMESGNSSVRPDNIDALISVGNQMVDALGHLGRNYTIGTPYQVLGYAASGTSFDWALQEKPGIYAYGFELRPRHHVVGGFILPAHHIIPNGQELLSSLLVLAKNLRL